MTNHPHTHAPGPAPAPLRPLARLIEPLYRREITRRNNSFDAGKRVVTLDRAVISVGNLSVGGTGKTPAVMTIARWLQKAGRRPAIAMRGYRAGHGSPAGGDEAEAYRHALEGVPVVAAPNRLDALLFHFASPEGERTDTVILDDGFQHRRIARQLDIVLIDAGKPYLAQPSTGGRLLPAGWLREPFESLARAHAVVLTHADRATPSERAALAAAIERASGRPPTAACRHAWSALTILDPATPATTNTKASTVTTDHLRGRRVLPVCAIGNPAPFLARAAELAGRETLEPITLRDHDPYAPRTIQHILNAADKLDADLILTTDKDWTKLARVKPAAWPCPVARPALILDFDHGEHELHELALAAAVDTVDEIDDTDEDPEHPAE